MTDRSSLFLHAGAAVLTRDDIRAVRTPEPTETWYPIPHDELITQTLDRLAQAGYAVLDPRHSLTKDGNRYFGTFGLGPAEGYLHGDAIGGDDWRLEVGLRNSHDQSFPAGLCVGSRVFVCDNLAFSSEIKLARKHTRFIMRDLPGMIVKAMSQLTSFQKKQAAQIETCKQTFIDDAFAHDFLIKAMDVRVVTPTRLPEVLKEWRKPSHEEFAPRTMWSLFNAATEVLKSTSEGELPRRTMALHGLVDMELNRSRQAA